MVFLLLALTSTTPPHADATPEIGAFSSDTALLAAQTAGPTAPKGSR
jgi:hypothetical protein